MADDNLLKEGIQAVRAGDRARGRALLSKVVLENPDSEAAWWYLGLSVDDNQQRLYCFKKVLALNPNHDGARARLGLAPTGRTAKKGARGRAGRGRQTLVLLLLGLFTLLVVIGGGGYVFLDSMGYLEGSLGEGISSLLAGLSPQATETPIPSTQGPAPLQETPVDPFAGVPTWTPTPSRTPRQPTATATATLPPTSSSPTEQPPTPETFPPITGAIPVDINNGTGPLTFFPGDFNAYRFEPDDDFSLELVTSLTFHLINPDEPSPLTLEVYLWNASADDWDVFGTEWGDALIPQASLYVSSDGVVIAAIRNWGDDPIDIVNTSFTYTGSTDDGAAIFYGLNREIIQTATEEAATATPAISD